MKKLIPLPLILLITFLWAPLSFAETITLKDGTILKGEVLSLQDGVYTLQTPSMGQIQVKDENIVSITKRPTTQSYSPRPAMPQFPGLPQLPSVLSDSPQMQGQVNQLIQLLLTDPSLMEEIQKIMEDPELMSLFSNTDQFNRLINLSPEEMQSDATFQHLIQNPKLQILMEKVRGHLFSPSTNP